MKGRVVLVLAFIAPQFAWAQFTPPITSLTFEQQQDIEDMTRRQLDAALITQHMREHPEDSPAAVAERIASHPDLVASASTEWNANWDREHPFKSSRERPKVPDDYLDKIIRAADARQRPDEDARIAALEAKIAELERAKPTRGPVTLQRSIQAPQSTYTPLAKFPPTPLPTINPSSILTRVLPDGRVIAMIGDKTIYFKNSEEARVAIDKIRSGLSSSTIQRPSN